MTTSVTEGTSPTRANARSVGERYARPERTAPTSAHTSATTTAGMPTNAVNTSATSAAAAKTMPARASSLAELTIHGRLYSVERYEAMHYERLAGAAD